MPDNTSGSIQSQYERDASAREQILERARLCAALTKPHILPPDGQMPDEKLPENYQSVGSRGVMNMSGKFLTSLFTEGWFDLEVSPEIAYDKTVDQALLKELEDELFLRQLAVYAILQSAPTKERNRHRRFGFLTRKGQAIDQILVTGDVLEQETDDYRIKVFRRDQYVTRRDSATDVLYHIIREQVDPLGLAEDVRLAAGLDDEELTKKSTSERMMDIYTIVDWQPLTKRWRIRQELNGKLVNESDEEISPFFATAMSIVSGENYGRGFVELNLGDLRSLNELEFRRLELLGIAAKHLWVLDYSCQTRPADLQKRSGSIIRARVAAGQVQDAATLHAGNVQEYGMLTDGIRDKTQSLSAAMMVESQVQPQKERVTRAQVMRIAQELDSALGGMYAPIADEQQIPLLRRTMWQMQRDRIIAPLPDEAIKITALTGIAAISAASKGQRVMEAAQVIAALGPQAMARIDMGVLTDVILRYNSVHEPGLIKSDEQIAAEQQAAMQQQLAMQVGAKAVDVAGNTAQSQMMETQR